MSCQNHHLPRKDQMFYLPDREIAIAAMTRPLVLADAAGFIAVLPAAPSCRAPDTRPCHPKTHLYHAWKIVHFGPILAVRILGRICSEKVVNPGICYLGVCRK